MELIKRAKPKISILSEMKLGYETLDGINTDLILKITFGEQ